MSGAVAPTTRPASSASCMYSRSNGHGSGHGIPAIHPSSSSQSGRSSRCTPRLTPVAARSRRRAVEQHRPLHHQHAVEVVGDGAELVRHEQHRGAVLLHEVHERVAEAGLRLDVDTRDRLVEHEQLGLGGQRLGDQHALLLAARQLREAAPAHLGERDRLERVVDRVAVGGADAPPPTLLREATRGHDLAHRRGQVGRDAQPLRARTRAASGRGGRRGPRRTPRPRPGCGASRPRRIRSSVDFPDPFGPMSAANSPRAHREAHVRRAPDRRRTRTTRPRQSAPAPLPNPAAGRRRAAN